MSPTKSDYVKTSKNPASDRPLLFALRQLRATMSRPVYWVINLAVVLVAAMAGPYFTLERFSFPERLVFWGTTLLGSAMIMTFLSIYAFRLTASRNWNWVLVSLVAGIAGVLPVMGTLYLGQGLTTGFAPGWLTWAPFGSLLISVAPPVIGVALVVNLIIELQDAERCNPAADTTDPMPAPELILTALHKKLPQHLGHDVVTVRAQDHYVEVTTPKGSAMVLMRLNDAVELLAPLNGLQVHRSWWVNLAHVTGTEPGSNGPVIVTSTDARIPVGRSYRSAFREAMAQDG